MKKGLYFTAVFVLLTTGIAFGAPDEVSEKLMNESISLMDFGCYMTKMQVRRELYQPFFKQDQYTYVVYCHYDWDVDKIFVAIAIIPRIAVTKERYKEHITMMHKHFMPIKEEYALNFAHDGYETSQSLYSEEYSELARKIVFRYRHNISIKIAEEQDGELQFFDFDERILK